MDDRKIEELSIKFTTAFSDIPIPAEMPSPPEFLLKKIQKDLTWVESPEQKSEFEAVAINSIAATLTDAPSPDTAHSTHTPSKERRTVDYLTYQQAIEERVTAETGYAEIYSEYLDLVSFNEKLLRKIRRHQNFKNKIRTVYDRARKGDQILLDNFKILQRNLVATEKALSDLQIENESLRISLTSHEEAYKGALAQIGTQQAQTESIHKQFQTLAEEFENRGIILDEADRKIRGYLTQIEQFGNSLRDLQDKFDRTRDENLLLESRMREIQLREAGVTALNEELAVAVTKSQKQIHELENKLRLIAEDSRQRITAQEQEIERLRENRQAENLVEQARKIQKSPEASREVLQKSATLNGPDSNRKQWDAFYLRWSHIINGLSSHSVPINRPLSLKDESPATQLISEVGDLDIY